MRIRHLVRHRFCRPLLGVHALNKARSLAQAQMRTHRTWVKSYTCAADCEKRCTAWHGKIEEHEGGDTVSTEAVAARRHAGTHLPVTWWKLELPTTTWHLLLN